MTGQYDADQNTNQGAKGFEQAQLPAVDNEAENNNEQNNIYEQHMVIILNFKNQILYFFFASSDMVFPSAVHSISTKAPKGNSLTATATLAGGVSVNLFE